MEKFFFRLCLSDNPSGLCGRFLLTFFFLCSQGSEKREREQLMSRDQEIIRKILCNR